MNFFFALICSNSLVIFAIIATLMIIFEIGFTFFFIRFSLNVGKRVRDSYVYCIFFVETNGNMGKKEMDNGIEFAWCWGSLMAMTMDEEGIYWMLIKLIFIIIIKFLCFSISLLHFTNYSCMFYDLHLVLWFFFY